MRHPSSTFLLIATAIFTFGALSPACRAQATHVAIESGKIEGAAEGSIISFKGVPFAAPPVGEFRWRAPQPVKPWSDVRPATSYASDCMQLPFPGDAAPLGTPPAEDCLYLNVWRPASSAAGEKLPVMVWIYGGGFVNGGSSPSVYAGDKFAAKGLVFVSFNYRLGRFGFFGFPGLTAENADGVLGNYGLMDQIAALKWVQRNIVSFGGDPANVTVFGESAGGFSVNTLLTTPLAEGLFAKAIMESGGGRVNIGGQRFLSTSVPNGPPSAESAGVAFAQSMGITGTGKDALTALRNLPAEQVRGKLNMSTMGDVTYSGPMLDGKLLLADPQAIYLSGAGAAVPLMIGANSMDLGFAPGRTKDELFAPFGVDRKKAMAAYDPQGSSKVGDVRTNLSMDRFMLEPARFVAGVFATRGLPSYEYRFSYVAESMRKEWRGAPHATEIPYVFDTVAARYGDKLAPADEKLAQQVLSYWASFAKTGDPNNDNQPKWPRYSPETDMILNFTSDGPVPEADPWKARLDVTFQLVSAGPIMPPPAPAKK